MIIRIQKNKNFTTIANFALNDPNLSLKAKGLWTYIMAKPDKWNFSSRSLATELKETKNTIATVLKELEEASYLKRGTIREENGKFSQGENILYEEPCTKKRDTGNWDTNKILNKINKDTETKVSEAPKEKKENLELKLFYMVLGFYDLPPINHNNIRKWAGEIAKLPDGAAYLQTLLDHDLRVQDGDFKPTLNTAFDVLNKKIKIQRFYNGGEDVQARDPRVYGEF